MNLDELANISGKCFKGELDSICDVSGVKVGHCTIVDGDTRTGVSVIIPCEGNIFRDKLIAASYVLNGFGKSLGLVQIDELGTLETPIALTNTLNVGLVHDALVEYSIRECEKDGIKLRSVNPVVCECNDASLNDIRLRAVKREHVFKAIEDADTIFALGDVGCGAGTSCHGLKGGVGTASRTVKIDGKRYTVGVFMQTNHGRLEDLRIDGKPVGIELNERLRSFEPDKGSCITVVATDAPLSSRQLRRVIKRAAIGLIRNGSYLGHGSGDIFIGFTTANRLWATKRGTRDFKILSEDRIDDVFRACAEASEAAVISSLINAHTVTSNGNTRYSIKDVIG